MWAPCRLSFPGFIQAYTKSDYCNWVKFSADADSWVICIDGSAFDSTQYAELMNLVENVLFEKMRTSPLLKRAWCEFVSRSEQWSGIDGDTSSALWEQMTTQAQENHTCAFTRLGRFTQDQKPWSPEIMKHWRNSQIQCKTEEERLYPWRFYLASPILGTTFSGHSTKTTLGNTLRSIFYMYYYVYSSGCEWDWATFADVYKV